MSSSRSAILFTKRFLFFSGPNRRLFQFKSTEVLKRWSPPVTPSSEKYFSVDDFSKFQLFHRCHKFFYGDIVDLHKRRYLLMVRTTSFVRLMRLIRNRFFRTSPWNSSLATEEIISLLSGKEIEIKFMTGLVRHFLEFGYSLIGFLLWIDC